MFFDSFSGFFTLFRPSPNEKTFLFYTENICTLNVYSSIFRAFRAFLEAPVPLPRYNGDASMVKYFCGFGIFLFISLFTDHFRRQNDVSLFIDHFLRDNDVNLFIFDLKNHNIWSNVEKPFQSLLVSTSPKRFPLSFFGNKSRIGKLGKRLFPLFTDFRYLSYTTFTLLNQT